MSLQLNSIMIAGNLTRDPEVRVINTEKGERVLCTFGLAINHVWKDEAGTRQQEATFIDVEVWGAQAAAVHNHFAKGQAAFISGHLKLDNWTDEKTGEKRSRHKVLATLVRFVESRRDGESVNPETGEVTRRVGAP